jgi:hypothetical protein
MTSLADLLSRLWDPVATSAGAVAMAAVGHFVRRFRERMATVRWSAWHQSIAIGGHDDTFGKVEVLHNGVPVHNLSMSYLELENESTRDLTNLHFSVHYADGTRFLYSVALLRGGLGLALGPIYTAGVTTFLAIPEGQRPANVADYQFLWTTRDYVVPILNRGAKVDFAALVEVPPGINPKAQLTCVHKGVRVRAKPPQPVMFGVNQNHGVSVGFVLGVMGIFVLAQLGAVDFWPIFLAFLAGATVLLLGALALHLVRLVVRVIG